MFSHLGDAIEHVSCDPGYEPTIMYINKTGGDILSLGVYNENNDFDPLRFDESFYRQAGVPFLAKWEKFNVCEGSHRLVPLGAPFIHDDPSRGFVIPMDGFRPDSKMDANILSWIPHMRTAAEIHCINSCFAILADLICNHPDDKLFLHHYARLDGGALPIFGREWTILDKPL